MNRKALAFDEGLAGSGMQAFVTGGTRGIGRAVVEELLPRLSKLTVLSKDEDHLSALAKYVAKKYPRCEFDSVAQDIADLDGLAMRLAAWRDAPSGTRPIDVLILNAGSYTEGSLLEIERKDYLHDLNVNLNSYLVAVQELMPCLRIGGKRRIFITGSTAAYETYPLVPTYGIAKFGLRALAINLRQELVSERIGVTFVAPGGTLTDMWEGEDVPKNRLLAPSDIGRIIGACLDLSEQAVVDEVIIRPMEGDIHE